jgi:hypothetical protein
MSIKKPVGFLPTVAPKAIFPVSALLFAVFLTTSCANSFLDRNDVPKYVEDGAGVVLRYDGNGAVGGSVPEGTNLYPGKSVAIADNAGMLTLSAEFYFSGWNSAADGSGTNYAGGERFKAELEDVTLYAAWKKIEGLLSPSWSTAGVPNGVDRNGNPSTAYYSFTGTPITVDGYRFSSTQSFTISVWFNSPDTLTGSYPKIFNQPGIASEFQYFMCLHGENVWAWVWPAGEVQTSPDDFVYIEYPVSANTWYHAVMVYDGAGTKKLELYIDGIRRGSVLYDEIDVPAPTTLMQIGSNSDGTYTGMIGDFRVYDRALGAAEVQALYYE